MMVKVSGGVFWLGCLAMCSWVGKVSDTSWMVAKVSGGASWLSCLATCSWVGRVSDTSWMVVKVSDGASWLGCLATCSWVGRVSDTFWQGCLETRSWGCRHHLLSRTGAWNFLGQWLEVACLLISRGHGAHQLQSLLLLVVEAVEAVHLLTHLSRMEVEAAAAAAVLDASWQRKVSNRCPLARLKMLLLLEVCVPAVLNDPASLLALVLVLLLTVSVLMLPMARLVAMGARMQMLAGDVVLVVLLLPLLLHFEHLL
jgi:hypothetical protein